MSTSLAQRVVHRTMLGNVVLAVIKFAAGIMAGSAALVAEAIHSTGDILASVAVLISFRLSGKAPDEKHHFGHGKIESIGSCLVGLMLVYIGYELTVEALGSLRSGSLEVPGVAALYVAVACIIIKEGMYRYTIKAAYKVGSQLLFADAWHHRTDMMILSGVFVGIVGARMGFPILDGLVALVISVLIIRLGVGVIHKGLGDLVDTAPDKNKLADMSSCINSLSGVADLHCIRARQHGSAIHLEIHIGVPKDMRVIEGHDVAKEVKTKLMASFPEVAHVMVHVNPVIHAP